MKKFFAFVLVFLFGCVFNIPLQPGKAPLREVELFGEGKNKILVINILGVISWEERGGGFFGYKESSIVARIKEELEKAREDERVKAVVLKVDSPGGLISASEIIYQELKGFRREKRIPVVAYISSLGASGAYYIISQADKIIASPGSAVGSIGVYMIKINAKGLSEKIGVQMEVIKAGKHKDSLLIHRGLTDEEREKLQNMINYYYENFKNVVKDGRGKRLKKSVDEIADGSIFSPQEALELGLIDGVGDIYSAIKEAAKLAGIKNYKVIAYTREGKEVSSIWDKTYSELDTETFLKSLVEPGLYIFYLFPGRM